MLRGVLGLTAITLTAACGAEEPQEAPATRGAAVVGGVESGPEDNAIVMITKPVDAGVNRCSATLVAKNLLLTALHCVAPINDTADFSCSPGGTLQNGGNGDGEIGLPLPADQILVYFGPVPMSSRPSARGVRIFSTGSRNICQGDLALIEIDTPFEGEGLRKQLAFERRVIVDDRITAVGFGQSDDPAVLRRHRRADIRVNDVGIPPGAFGVGEGPCLGDSGGPALADDTGAILGVYSRLHVEAGSTSCTGGFVRSTYTQVRAYSTVIQTAFDAIGERPWLEGQPEPMGAAGAAGQSGAAGTAGASPEGGAGGAAGAPPEPPPKRGGGDDDSGCSVGHRGGSSSAFGALGLLLGAAWLRSRRRSR